MDRQDGEAMNLEAHGTGPICPECGANMNRDGSTSIPVWVCLQCGYIEPPELRDKDDS